ncbi:septal ring lytic transglycosylase RlpA family protein [Luteibacter yeojuensis]|uniref:septal ring lytic transglycosylase RlpA family protein n=1 Tax=Luteibacter yeojuensis TaxID=345309 RepID=UPI001E5B036F|nr:septal ring lytic transglycosylase RlpA family protein [Luteibacter yeojuensis]
MLLAACGGGHNTRPSSSGKRGGGSSSRFNDDISKSQGSRYRSNSDSVPTAIPDVSKIPEPVPKAEPRSLYGNKSPYSVLGQTYNVLPSPKGYVERGIASFYGNKFHGYKTSNLEEYDMYQFSAAHKTLPLPSYARVTNLQNGKSVIVRINDRGPFHENRIIDLSFAAAVKIGVWPSGTGLVEVRAIDPNDPAAASAAPPPYVQAAPRPAPVTAPPPPSRPAGTPPPPAGRTVTTPAAVAAGAALAAAPRPAPNSTTATPVAVGNPEDAGPVAGMTDARVADALPPAAGSPVASRPPSADIAAPVGTSIPTKPAQAAQAAPPAATPAASPASVPGKPSIYLQVGAFSDVANANRVADQLNRAGLGPVSVIETTLGGRSVRRVRVGPLADVDTADKVTDQIAGMGLPRPSVAVD